MRALLAGLAALAMLFLMANYIVKGTPQDFSDTPAIVAVVQDAFAPAAPNASGVVVTQNYTYMNDMFIADMASAASEVAAVISTRPQTGLVSTINVNFDKYTIPADSRLNVLTLNWREAGWTPGAHTERLHRLGSPSITTT